MDGDQPILYRGPGFSLKGDKDRFVLPSQFRNVVKRSSSNVTKFLLGKHDRWNCLVGYGFSRQTDLLADLEDQRLHARTSGAPFDYDQKALEIFSYAEVSFDDSGRFNVPAGLTKPGCIGDEIFFMGGGAFFALWSPAELEKMGPEWDAAKSQCASLWEEALKAKARKG